MATNVTGGPHDTPVLDAETEPFFAAAKKGKLLVRRCRQCSERHWYPRALCPFCQADTDWEECSGDGVIYSVSVTRRAGPVPYAIAYVTIAEGVTMLTNIIDCDVDDLRIGQPVRVCFRDSSEGVTVPMFTVNA